MLDQDRTIPAGTGKLVRPLSIGLLISLAALAVAACSAGGSSATKRGPAPAPPAYLAPDSGPTGSPAPDPNMLELVFPYGSEKQAWLTDVTDAFNAAGHKAGSGKRIQVKAVPMGSGELMTEIGAGRLEAHLASPASGAFIKLANAESRSKAGNDLIGPTQNLVLSPVVIAMWRPMAEAIGWGKQPVGWSEIISLANSTEGWAQYGFPQWGRFRFGHTHPEYSNSGLIALLAETYAATGKQAGLSLTDLQDPKVGQYLEQVERSVVHYGSSTGFFAERLFKGGPEYLSAAVLYENSVIESYDPAKYGGLPFPIVAIYPKEGTFWADHPVGIVDRPWVTADQRAAAQTYIDFLLARAQQEKALQYGFRPADPALALGAPIDADHGVDPKQPVTTLEIPPTEVMQRAIELWREHKKHAHVALVLDTSGSMQDDNKIAGAKAGAGQLIALLADADQLSLMSFSDQPLWLKQHLALAGGRAEAESAINGLIANGNTTLYDAVDMAYQAMASDTDPSRIAAIVVLSDGEDTKSTTSLEALLEHLRQRQESGGVRVFTIGYGTGAKEQVLRDISEATHGRYYSGNPDTIRAVFKDIATFF